MGRMARTARKIAPARVSRVMVYSRKSAVGAPGRTPGMKPPLRFTSSEIWIGLNMNETQK